MTAPGLGARELPIRTGLPKVLRARHVGQRVGSKRVAFIRILLYACRGRCTTSRKLVRGLVFVEKLVFSHLQSGTWSVAA